MPSPEQYPRRRTVPWRVLAEEALVVDPKKGYLYPLNRVAARIWQLCDGAHTVETIIGRLVEEFDAEPVTIRQDAVDFLDRLTESGLVTVHDAPAPEDTDARGSGGPRRTSG